MSLKMPVHLSSGKYFIQVPPCMTGNNTVHPYRFKSEEFEGRDCIDANLFLPCGSSKGDTSGHFVYAETTLTMRP